MIKVNRIFWWAKLFRSVKEFLIEHVRIVVRQVQRMVDFDDSVLCEPDILQCKSVVIDILRLQV